MNYSKLTALLSDILIEIPKNMRGVFISGITLVLIWAIYFFTKKALLRYFKARRSKAEDIQNFMLMWRYIWLILAVVFAGIGLSGSLATLGISAAFLGAVMGWSLQAPVTGIAAWIMIIAKRPFKIGDRVIIAGIVGDVVDITLTHIILNQVGGTVSGEEKSGRIVMIPNATMFQQTIHNYTYGSRYILDEVLILITFNSDSAEAERILIKSAEEATSDIIQRTGQQPFVRVEIAESGVRLRLRYQTIATDRQRITSKISKIIIREFRNNHLVEFAYPHSEIIYRPKNSPLRLMDDIKPVIKRNKKQF